jgi:hypothetical protein
MTSQAFTMQNPLFMRFFRKQARPWAIGLVAAALAGCESQLPTVTGENSFPSDRIPITIEASIPAAQFVTRDTVFEGFGGSLGYLLVANRFEGALTSRGLVRFSGFPDSVNYVLNGATRTDRTFTYGRGRIVARVDSTASRPRAQLALQLFPVTQDWDTTAVSWTNAVNRPGAIVPWSTPGGTVGPVAATGSWVPGDTVLKDSVVWQLDSVTVGRLARGELRGLVVGAADPGARLELSRLSMSVSVRPAGRPDTAIAFQITQGPQTFIVTPDPPTSAGSLRVGGLGGARSILQLDLSQQVSTCPTGQTGAGCRLIPLSDVTLDNLSLVLDPVAVPSGYRPITAVTLASRRILEPELGRRSPLGELLSSRNVAGDFFAASSLKPVIIDLTATAVSTLAAGDTTGDYTLDLALVTDIGQVHFGSVWFDNTPRLRVLYTVVKRPELP